MKTLPAVFALVLLACARGADLPPIAVEPQPFLHAVGSLIDAMDFLGTPFTAEEKA